jgi:hypothetical protein
MRQRNPGERLRPHVPHALQQPFPSHPRIDQDRNRARLEQREHQREKRESRPHHQKGFGSAPDADFGEAARVGVGVPVELLEGDFPVAGRGLFSGAVAEDDGGFIGGYGRAGGEARADIHRCHAKIPLAVSPKRPVPAHQRRYGAGVEPFVSFPLLHFYRACHPILLSSRSRD